MYSIGPHGILRYDVTVWRFNRGNVNNGGDPNFYTGVFRNAAGSLDKRFLPPSATITIQDLICCRSSCWT